jgi:hypothetical protein
MSLYISLRKIWRHTDRLVFSKATVRHYLISRCKIEGSEMVISCVGVREVNIGRKRNSSVCINRASGGTGVNGVSGGIGRNRASGGSGRNRVSGGSEWMYW